MTYKFKFAADGTRISLLGVSGAVGSTGRLHVSIAPRVFITAPPNVKGVMRQVRSQSVRRAQGLDHIYLGPVGAATLFVAGILTPANFGQAVVGDNIVAVPGVVDGRDVTILVTHDFYKLPGNANQAWLEYAHPKQVLRLASDAIRDRDAEMRYELTYAVRQVTTGGRGWPARASHIRKLSAEIHALGVRLCQLTGESTPKSAYTVAQNILASTAKPQSTAVPAPPQVGARNSIHTVSGGLPTLGKGH